MMTEELALPVPVEGEGMESLKDGLAMFLSFNFFGMMPVLSFVIIPYVFPSFDEHQLFACACGITAIALLVLGGYKV